MHVLCLTFNACVTVCALLQGGDYDTDEIALCAEALKSAEAELQADVDARQSSLQELQAAQQQTLDAFGDAFSKAFDTSLQELSMREGLGKKYGAPRRNAQSLIRAQMGWSDAAEAAITKKLDELEALANDAPGEPPSTPVSVDEEEAASLPLSLRIQAVLQQLRDAVYQRAMVGGSGVGSHFCLLRLTMLGWVVCLFVCLFVCLSVVVGHSSWTHCPSRFAR